MMVKNYSSIGHLLAREFQNKKNSSGYRSKESEPKFSEPLKVVEAPVEKAEEQPERSSETAASSSQAQIQVVPDLPELDDDLKEEGVELEDHDTIFVGSRRIDLPLPLEKVDQGLHKPVTSGWRWIAELTKYILARFHIVIKKVGHKFKLVQEN